MNDTARLDWLEHNIFTFIGSGRYEHTGNIRAAIDAAQTPTASRARFFQEHPLWHEHKNLPAAIDAARPPEPEPQVAPGEPWRMLEVGEVIQEGDEMQLDSYGCANALKWEPVIRQWIGQIIVNADIRYRRRVAPAPTEEPRKHLVLTAAYWFKQSDKMRKASQMGQALLAMENAYNHVENALAAARDELTALRQRTKPHHTPA